MKKMILIFVLLSSPSLMVEASFNNLEEPSCLEADVIFLVDWSISVNDGRYFILKSLTNLSKRLSSPYMGDVRLGLVAFSDSIVLSTFNTYKIDEAIETLSGIPTGNYTDLASALIVSKEMMMNFRKDNQNRKQFVIIISDGEPSSSLAEWCLYLGDKIKEDGIIIFSIFVETISGRIYPSTGEAYLERISTEYCYFRSDYSSLSFVLESLNFCL